MQTCTAYFLVRLSEFCLRIHCNPVERPVSLRDQDLVGTTDCRIPEFGQNQPCDRPDDFLGERSDLRTFRTVSVSPGGRDTRRAAASPVTRDEADLARLESRPPGGFWHRNGPECDPFFQKTLRGDAEMVCSRVRIFLQSRPPRAPACRSAKSIIGNLIVIVLPFVRKIFSRRRGKLHGSLQFDATPVTVCRVRRSRDERSPCKPGRPRSQSGRCVGFSRVTEAVLGVTQRDRRP